MSPARLVVPELSTTVTEVNSQPMTLTLMQSGSQEGFSKQAFLAHDLERFHRSFAEDGYVVFKGVVSKERLAHLNTRIHSEFARAIESGTLFSGGGLVSGHLNCFPGEESRFIYDELHERGIIDFIKAIDARAVRLPNVGCNFNLPKSAAQHIHMDRTFTKNFMIANIAVVDAEIANGAIELVPGTHKKFYKYWQFFMEGPARIRLPMQQGDVLVRVSNLWHRGMPNLTSVPRPMVALSWEDGGSLEPDPFQVNGGEIKFRPNWFRPSNLGRLRERTYVAAPFTYSAYRIVDSLLTNKGY
jgi:hypothetical protein